MIANGLAARPAGDADNRARVRQEFGLHADAKLLVRIGRLDYYKGNQILLPALAACDTDAHLLLVGDGPERHALETQARELGLNGRVICTGYRDDVGELLGAADLFVISSLQEGLPMVLLEAMAARVPVISTNVGAIHTVIRPDSNGWLVAPGEVAPLGDALRQALREPETAQAYAAQAHADYLARYSRETMGRQYLALYEHLGVS